MICLRLQLLVFCCSIALLLSCEDSESVCIDEMCANGGTCIDNKCDCPEGYFGESCEEFDTLKVQLLLNSGLHSPLELAHAGISLDSLYGKTYQGGIVFFVDINDDMPNMDGLLAYESDQYDNWGCNYMDIEKLNNIIDFPSRNNPEVEISTRIGDGKSNTDAILTECTERFCAAKLCRDLGPEWFLPSRGELNLIYHNLFLNGYGSFKPNKQYWSSTEYDYWTGWYQDFYNGFQGLLSKFNTVYFRPVKTF